MEQQSAAIKDCVVNAEDLLLMLADSTHHVKTRMDLNHPPRLPSFEIVLIICVVLVVPSIGGQKMNGTTE
jgi:hypothetical protein